MKKINTAATNNHVPPNLVAQEGGGNIPVNVPPPGFIEPTIVQDVYCAEELKFERGIHFISADDG